MANNKDLFKQAIAEAKSVRDAAIANAKDALEETLTPHLKDMLAAKLQEMEDVSLEDEDSMQYEEEELEAPVELEAPELEDDAEQSEDEAEVETPDGDLSGDEELGDISIDQFKDLIKGELESILTDMGLDGDSEGEMDMGMDMDAGDIEGMGDEMPSIEEPEDLGMGMDSEPEDEESIDLDELLAELEGSEEEDLMEMDSEEDEIEEGKYSKKKFKEEEVEESYDSEKEEVKKDLEEALETIEALRHELNEVNILNSKLLYVNRIFKANNLTEQQKVNIIAAFDKAETVKEVKLVYETVSDSVVNSRKAQSIKESVATKKAVLGGASRATGVTAKKPEVINEVSETVRRMQKLAGII